MKVKIDGETYRETGKIYCKRGSGEDSEQFHFDILESEHGEKFLLNEENDQRWLYKRCKHKYDPNKAEKVHEVWAADEIRGGDLGTVKDAEISWLTLKEPLAEAETPFTGTSEAMYIEGLSDRLYRLYQCVPVWKHQSGELFTARFPAEQLPQAEFQEVRVGRISSALEIAVALLLMGGLGLGAATGNSLPLSIFWWAAPILCLVNIPVKQTSPLKSALNFYFGAFFFHFATHFVDVMVLSEVWGTPQATRFESARAAVVVTVLLCLRFLWYRGYKILVDGSWTGGGCAWLLYGAGLFCYSISEEFWYFPWFSWYAGILPWGPLWIVFLLFGLKRTWSDYRTAPLNAEEFRHQLRQLHRLCEGGLESARAGQEEFVHLCDDLEDGVRISKDPAVAALFPLGESLLRLRDAGQNLADMGELTEKDKELVDTDLKTTAADLENLIERCPEWGRGESKLQELRVSPYLVTSGW